MRNIAGNLLTANLLRFPQKMCHLRLVNSRAIRMALMIRMPLSGAGCRNFVHLQRSRLREELCVWIGKDSRRDHEQACIAGTNPGMTKIRKLIA
jgi:hypothetical protein